MENVNEITKSPSVENAENSQTIIENDGGIDGVNKGEKTVNDAIENVESESDNSLESGGNTAKNATDEIENSNVDSVAETADSDEESEEPLDESGEETRKWFAADREKFLESYPDVDLMKLLEDEKFVRFVGNRAGVEPLKDIYADYEELKGELLALAREQAKAEYEKRLAKRGASPGSLTELKTQTDGEYYTIDEIKKMSADYIDEHWDKVQRSIQRAKK
ncbi:MAG: hypothetical protein IJS93_03335 [Clostridia bacterium]|nr:hypothetical protein [Clostridia bacterium]